jgi:hypothetical protein
MIRKVSALLIVGLVIGFSFSGLHTASAPGFGATCLNRHAASFQSILIHAAAVNYTGQGDEIVAPWLWGYDITVVFKIDPAVSLNPQLDTTNGSIFFAHDILGAWHVGCYYNIGPTDTIAYLQFHPANLTGFGNSHQLVTLSTGPHTGQYNVSWVGP